jgi:hypothetical protein
MAMPMSQIEYRTDGNELSDYAVVPTSWSANLIAWLWDTGSEVIARTDNVLYEKLSVPREWPSLFDCYEDILISDRTKLAR